MTVEEAVKNVTAYVYMEAENIPTMVARALDVLKDNARKAEQYEAIGTVEELKEAKEQYDNINSAAESVALSGLCDYGTAKEAMITEIKRSLDCSLKEYQKIGTVSEFRELKEKATAKKVVVKGVMGFEGEESYCCPNCGLDISQWGYGVCIDCGQKLLY